VVARARAAAGDVIAFTHGHFGRILAAAWIDQPPAFGAHITLDTGTLNILGWEHESPVILTWNQR
jgi:probable phosphoglycerate mutase